MIRTSVLLTVVFLLGCGDDDGAADVGPDVGADVGLVDVGPVDAASDASDSGAIDGGDGGLDDAASDVPTDAGAGCATATPLTAMTNGEGGTFFTAQGVFESAGEVHHYTFEAEEDSWIDVSAGTAGTPPTNATLTLLRDDVQLAFNDDAITGGRDARLVHHIVDAGTYCLRVSEANDESGPTYEYGVQAVPIDFALYDGYNLDAEPNDTPDAPQTGLTFFTDTATGQISATLVGVFEDASDVDVLEVSAPAGAVWTSILLEPSGSDASGATVELGEVSVFSEDVRVARVDATDGIPELGAPIEEATTYQIAIASSGDLGANPFWVVHFRTSDGDNTLEGSGDNDSAAMAETPSGFTLLGRTSYFIGGELAAGDVDWWAIDADADDTLELSCSAVRLGSGARDMEVSLYGDPGVAALQTETETATAFLRWGSFSDASEAGIVATETRTYHLSLAAGTNDPDVASRYYRCGVFVVDP